MRKLAERLFQAAYFFLCFAPVPIFAGHALLGEYGLSCLMAACLLPVAYLLSLLPGRVGGKAREADTPIASAPSSGGDPNPDKNLRNEALPVKGRRAFPLRGVCCAVVSLLALGAAFLVCHSYRPELWWPYPLGLSAILALMLPFALAEMCSGAVGDMKTIVGGVVLYVVSAVALAFLKIESLSWLVGTLACAFLALTAVMLNDMSMLSGMATRREKARPSSRMRTRNRLLLLAVFAVVAAIAYFDAIRRGFERAMQGVGWAIASAIAWLGTLFAGSEEGGSGMGGGADQMDLSALGGSETGSIWKYLEKFAYVLTALIVLVLLFFAFRKIGRMLRNLFRKLLERMRAFAGGLGEEYQDVSESLFDWGDLRDNMREDWKKRLSRFTNREKRWDDMDARERVRFVARSLMRKRRLDSLSAKTMREAAPELAPEGAAERLSELYDRARYSDLPVQNEEAESLRREARV